MPAPGQDVLVVGGGHNALVAATLLARSGRSVRVLERSSHCGGAAVSGRPFDVDARLSRYSYLVSLFPRELMTLLGVDVELRRRRVSSCTPDDDRALVISDDEVATRRSFDEVTGDPGEYDRWLAWQRVVRRVAAAVAPTVLQPLVPAGEVRALMGEEAWSLATQAPLGAALERSFNTDLVRGIVLTDALIGTYARSDEASLRQNRCFLYHVIGNGTGDWDVPVGGMGALTGQLESAARAAGVRLETGVEVTSVDSDGSTVVARTSQGAFTASALICTAAPAVLDGLLGRQSRATAPGAQVKVNLVLSRLPRLRSGVDPRVAFAGTLHVNERMTQLDEAFEQAALALPDPMPCEVYCHTLTDPSILGPELVRSGAQTLTLFALQTPTGLFDTDQRGARRAALDGALRSLQSVLAESLADCVLRTPDGQPCIEVLTPSDLQDDLAMPGGNIFHGDLSWPWAETDAEVGTWGVETDLSTVFIGGSGARRGGAVSGIGGHNAAMAVQHRLSGAPRR